MIASTLISAQETSMGSGDKSVQTVQPKIMVIPYVKEGEDLRTILEDDVNKRIAITKIKEAFDNRGFTTVDFAARLEAANANAAFSMENKSDFSFIRQFAE